MKKVIYCFIFIIFNVNIVNANTFTSEEIPYYIKLNNNVINVKKIYDTENQAVVFNYNPYNYEVNTNLTKYSEYDKTVWKIDKSQKDFLSTIIYYGYLQEPSDLNYYLTQFMIWNYITGIRFQMINIDGEVITSYKNEYSQLVNKVMVHKSRPPFFDDIYNSEIWDTKHFSYAPNYLVLDSPLVDGLEIINVEDKLTISNQKAGNYNLIFSKEYDQEMYCYSDGKNIYWQSLKGPENISYELKYNVQGIRFSINEKLIGVNNKIGDAKIQSAYELYLNDELKEVIYNNDVIYLKSNSSYKLRDITNNSSTYNVSDMNFIVSDDEFVLNIEKSVINKKFDINITDEKEYYVYLKSNNELYMPINKNTESITLPYGTYYITNLDNYYEEFNVYNDIEEIINIESLLDTKQEDEMINPKTNDFIFFNVISGFFSILCIMFLLKKCRQ